MRSSSAISARARYAVLFAAFCLAPCSLLAQAPRLITHPSPPPANQPFDGELSILAPVGAVGPSPSSASYAGGNYILFYYDDCYPTSCSSGGLAYRSFPLHFPPLVAGTYDVRFWLLSPLDIDPPPTVADFSLKVVAGPSSVPGTGVPALVGIALLLMMLAWRKLLERKAVIGL